MCPISWVFLLPVLAARTKKEKEPFVVISAVFALTTHVTRWLRIAEESGQFDTAKEWL